MKMYFTINSIQPTTFSSSIESADSRVCIYPQNSWYGLNVHKELLILSFLYCGSMIGTSAWSNGSVPHDGSRVFNKPKLYQLLCQFAH